MIDRDTIELMHAELDGTNTAEQSQRLRRRLEEDHGAKEVFDDLQRLVQRLESYPDVDPPTHLVHRIIDAVPFGRAPWPARPALEPGVFSWLRRLASRPRLAYTVTFALGLTIGASAFFLKGYDGRARGPVSSLLDIEQVSGTMGGVEPLDKLEVVDDLAINLEAASGRIRLERTGNVLVVDLTLNSERPVEWILSFDSGQMAIDGFRRVHGDAGVFVTESAVSSRQLGGGRYIVRLTAQQSVDSPSLQLYDAGELILEKQLSVDP